MTAPDWYRWDHGDLLLRLKLQPKASCDAFAGPQNDRLRVRITAPPVDGQANAHLVTWLARQFGVTRAAVIIESGTASPHKRIRIRHPARIPDVLDGLSSA